MYRRALFSIALVVVAVLTAGAGALAFLGSSSVDPAPVAEETLFDVGEAGSVRVSSDGTDLHVVSVTTADGWQHRIARPSGESVNVVFVASDLGIDFHAALDDDSIVGKIRIVAPPPEENQPIANAAADEPTQAGVFESRQLVEPVMQASDTALQSEPAASKPVLAEAGPEGLGLGYGKIIDETPIIDPVLDGWSGG